MKNWLKCESSIISTVRILDCALIFHVLQFVKILLTNVAITETPNWILMYLIAVEEMRSVATSCCPSCNHIGWHILSIVGPTDAREEINESCACIVFVIAQFAGLVVPRKYMMVVVPAFAESGQCNRQTLSWTNTSVNATDKIQWGCSCYESRRLTILTYRMDGCRTCAPHYSHRRRCSG